MTIEQALDAIEKITMRDKQHLADDERAKLRAILAELTS